MTPYEEQKNAITKFQADPDVPPTKKTLAAILASIERAESLERVLEQIKICASRNWSACQHCSSVANIITEYER